MTRMISIICEGSLRVCCTTLLHESGCFADDDDVADNKRHLAQEGKAKQDPNSKSAKSLKNWGTMLQPRSHQFSLRQLLTLPFSHFRPRSIEVLERLARVEFTLLRMTTTIVSMEYCQNQTSLVSFREAFAQRSTAPSVYSSEDTIYCWLKALLCVIEPPASPSPSTGRL